MIFTSIDIYSSNLILLLIFVIIEKIIINCWYFGIVIIFVIADYTHIWPVTVIRLPVALLGSAN